MAFLRASPAPVTEAAPRIPDPSWRAWAAQPAPTVTVAANTAWLDAGQPDPESAADRVREVLRSITTTAHRPGRARAVGGGGDRGGALGGALVGAPQCEPGSG